MRLALRTESNVAPTPTLPVRQPNPTPTPCKYKPALKRHRLQQQPVTIGDCAITIAILSYAGNLPVKDMLLHTCTIIFLAASMANALVNQFTKLTLLYVWTSLSILMWMIDVMTGDALCECGATRTLLVGILVPSGPT